MSESNLHMQFFNEENVPIPLPPADSSWKLMEQALNKAMPVNAPNSGSASPHAGSISIKLLTIAKYAAVTVLCAGVIVYGIYRMARSTKKVAPAEEHSTITRDSVLKATDSVLHQTKQEAESGGISKITAVSEENNSTEDAGKVSSNASGSSSGTGGKVNNGLSTSGKASANASGHGVASGGAARNGGAVSGNASSNTSNSSTMNNGLSTSGKASANVSGHGAASGGAARNGGAVSGNALSNTSNSSTMNKGLSTSGKASANTSGHRTGSAGAGNNGGSSSGKTSGKNAGALVKSNVSNHLKKSSIKNESTGKSLKSPADQPSEGSAIQKNNGKLLPDQTATTNDLSTNNQEGLTTTDKSATNSGKELVAHLLSPDKSGTLPANNNKKISAAAQRKENKSVSQATPMNAAAYTESQNTMPANAHEADAPAISSTDNARIQFQSVRNESSSLSTSPLKVSAETMARISNFRMPRNKYHTTGNWEIMGQWSIPMPVTSNPGYYKGPTGNSQLYKLLIPGIRVQRTWDNAAVSLDLNFVANQIYDNKPYSHITTGGSPTNEQSLTLLQTFGYKAGLAYHHRLAGQFFGSAGIQGYLGNSGSIQEMTATRDSSGVRSKTIVYMNNGSLWNSLGKFQGNITAEVYYDHKRWQAAVRTAIPVLHTAKDSLGTNMKPAVQVEILLRWKIWKNK